MAQESPSNGSSGLVKLLNQLNTPALVIVMMMSGGNWFATKSGNDFNASEINRATREIHSLYDKLMEYERRQTVMMENQRGILESNSTQLHNQNQMLENQRLILGTMEKNQEKTLQKIQ